MQSDLARRVFRGVTRQGMLRAGDCLGVGVSGGADSVALLRLMDELQSELGIRLTILHFNHQLRGAESDEDEAFVSALAAERHIPFLAGRGDVGAAAREHGWNLEDAGRRLRHEYFRSVLSAGRVTRVAVAHTADDQAETVLARLVRGTGPSGLAAIYPVVDLNEDAGADAAAGELVRPLLEVRRSELREYLVSMAQTWREDSSNQDQQRLRARIRHQILPLIECELQPGIVGHLGRLAQMAREDEAFWASLVAERLAAIVHRKGAGAKTTDEDKVALSVRCADVLAPFPWLGSGLSHDARMAISRRLVRGLVEELCGDRRELSAQHVEQVLSLAAGGSSSRRSHLPGVVVERSFEWLWFHPALAAGSHDPNGEQNSADAGKLGYPYSHDVELGATGQSTVVVIPEIQRRFQLKVIDWPIVEGDTDIDSHTLDRDLLRSPLVLRNWRAGDSFRPRGRRSVHKLKHFLRVERVGVRDRAGWPVLTSNGQLVWARGLPVAAEFAPRKDTRAGVLIAEEEI